jgi:hypothetical protein
MTDLHATLREGLQALGECDPRQLDPAGIVIRAACEWKCAEIAEQLVEQGSCGAEARQVLAKARAQVADDRPVHRDSEGLGGISKPTEARKSK